MPESTEATPAPPRRIRPLARVEYDALVEQGFLHGEPIELIEGQLIARSPEGELHSGTVRRLLRLLIEAIAAEEAEIGSGNPIALSDLSEPEPDIAVFPPGTYRGHHPTTATLLVEVSCSSVRWDLNGKSLLYAGADIPEYWVVDLVAHRIVCHRDPAPDGYATVTTHRDGVLRPLHHPQAEIDVGTLLG